MRTTLPRGTKLHAYLQRQESKRVERTLCARYRASALPLIAHLILHRAEGAMSISQMRDRRPREAKGLVQVTQLVVLWAKQVDPGLPDSDMG